MLMLWLSREFLLMSWMTRIYADDLVVEGVSLSRDSILTNWLARQFMLMS